MTGGSLRTFKSARGKLILIAVLSVITAQFEALALVLIVPVAQALSEGKQSYAGSFGPISFDVTLDSASLLSVVSILIATILTVLTAWVRSKYMSAFERTERDRVFEAYMAADWEVQAAERSGRLHTLSTYTTRASLLLGAIMSGIKGAISMGIFVLIAFAIDWRAALAILVSGTLLFGCLRPLAKRVGKLSGQSAALGMEYGEELNEFSTLSREVQLFNAWPAVEVRMNRISEDRETALRKSQFLGQSMGPAYQYAGLLLVILVVLMATRTSIDAGLGSLGAIALLLIRGLNYGSQVQTAWQTVLESAPYLDKLEESVARYEATKVADGGDSLGRVTCLSLRDLGFSYPASSGGHVVDALRHVDLDLRVGEVVGVVGPSGAGKSTLAQILLRLRQPTSGQLLVDGVPADDYSQRSWHDHVALVPQETRLFHGTVTENIAFLGPTVTHDDVVEAAAAAGLADIIETLPDGYDTLIGPAFRDLSGGQVQRMGIARALVRHTEVLVLDEPTSALDVHSESVIHETIGRLRGSALVVVIAHRLSTLNVCDKLVVLNDGAVEASGTLAEVIEASDFFRRAMELGTLDLPTE